MHQHSLKNSSAESSNPTPKREIGVKSMPMTPQALQLKRYSDLLTQKHAALGQDRVGGQPQESPAQLKQEPSSNGFADSEEKMGVANGSEMSPEPVESNFEGSETEGAEEPQMEGGDEDSFEIESNIPFAEDANDEGNEERLEEDEVTMPDFEYVASENYVQSDAVAGRIRYTSVIKNHGNPRGNFGLTVPSQKVSGIRIKKTKAGYRIRFKYRMKMDWSVASSGPSGQRNIKSHRSHAITMKNYVAVATDLTPNMADLNGRPPRNNFWNKSLTKRHEKFHARDAVALGRAGAGVAQAWLNTQTAFSIADCKALVTAAAARITSARDVGMVNPGREQRAYGDGAPLYLALANRITAKGTANGYRKGK